SGHRAARARLLGVRRRAAAGCARREHHLARQVVAARDQERNRRRGSRRGEPDGRAHWPASASRRRHSGMKRPIVYVAGTGRGLPDKILRNEDFLGMGLDTSDEWITSRTGIKERRLAGPTDTTCSMGADAARRAMAKAGVTAGELDAIVLSTATPDRLLPSTAVDLQAELGATRAAAFDISAACTGFIYANAVAEGLIATGMAQTILVVSTERMSSIVDWTDRSTCVLFGDGAGAVVLKRARPGTQRGLLGAFLRSDGTLADLLYRPAGGAKIPFSQQVLDDKSYLVKMAGREVFKHAVREMAE